MPKQLNMKRLLLLAFLVLSLLFNSYAEKVDEETARIVAFNFLSAKAPALFLKSHSSLRLICKEISSPGLNASASPIPLYYVFSSDSTNFIIIPGDDKISPVLGYSIESGFDVSDMPPALLKWLENYKKEIIWLSTNSAPADYSVVSEWDNLKNGLPGNRRNTTAVAPLLSTKWNQAPYYNAACPGGSVTGCVATAMTQIMKFWNYPANGSGFHSYNHSDYGTLSANFAATTYNWSQMPNMVNGPNSAVATLMYHVGVSVEMDYSPDASGAYVISSQSPVTHCAEYALETYFGYTSGIAGIERDNYSSADWINLLKVELNAGRPVLYAGFGSGGGHAFVADGYDNTDRFHFNWGWGGMSDGYFLVGSLNPGSTGSGGGSGGYNSGQQAVIGIKPPVNNQTYDMALYDNVNLSSSTIWYGQSFSLSTNIANFGNNTFSGDYAAAIFDAQGDFIDFVDVLTGYTLEGGYAYTNNLEFSCEGLLSMLPGDYSISIFYKPTGGNWVIVRDNEYYYNIAEISVINSNDIELYSEMNISQGTTITQGQTVTTTLNILNDGATTFTGTYQLGLYNLEGAAVQSLGIYNETTGLPPGYMYAPPYLSFTSSAINVAPGSYYIALMHKENNGDWEITGSSHFLNPIRVKVVAASLQQDPYEANDIVASAYALPISFNNDAAKVTTTGSNCHNGSDFDFYSINLPLGYTYTLSPRLHDSYNSGNGLAYSLDALFSLSGDGINWSSSFDDVLPENIGTDQGGIIYFQVAPYFEGQTGTYLLAVDITRVPIVGMDELSGQDSINIYPNPGSGNIFVDLRNFEGTVSEIHLLNALGANLLKIYSNNQPFKPEQGTKSLALNNQGVIDLSLSGIQPGIYFLRLTTSKGTFTKKVMLTR